MNFVVINAKSENTDEGIKNDLFLNWNNIPNGSGVIKYTNSTEVWTGLYNKYSESIGSILMISANGIAKIYVHYGTQLKPIA